MKAFRASDFRVSDNDGQPMAGGIRICAAPRVTYHADLAAAQADPALAALFAAADAPLAPAPFDRLAWWQGLASDCGMTPLYAAAHDAASDSAVLLALHRAPHRLEALANWYTFRWRPLAIGPGAPGLIAAIAADLTHAPGPRAGRVTLAPLPAVEAATIAAAFRAAGWVVATAHSDINHILPVRGRSYALYLAGRPGPLRTTLARKGNKVRCTIHTGCDDAAWAAYEAVYRASWKPAEGFPAFLRRFAEAEGAAGRLRLGIAYAGGAAGRTGAEPAVPAAEPVAAQLWTVEAGTAFIHKLAYAERAHALSPGTTLTAALFEHVLDRDRVALVDFGCGDESYKRDWMEATRPRLSLDMIHPADPRHWPHLLRAGARAASRWWRGG